jgi:hypothetical protein
MDIEEFNLPEKKKITQLAGLISSKKAFGISCN